MYKASIPVFSRNLKVLDAVLAKAAAHADAHGIDPSVLVNARLYPNMFPLVRQVQIATDIALRGAARLAGQEPTSVPDDESSFDELRGRLRHALETLGAYRAEQIDGSETRAIHLKLPSGEMKFDGQSFLLNFVLPNMFFHVTTAYNILRHNGVPLGKTDFLGTA